MTAYVLTGACNIRQLGTLSPSGSSTARSGGDTVDTNGFNFTIDQDSRYGLTGTTSTTFGTLTINAAKGGNINIDGRYVRMIPFTGGSGTITAGTTITCGSGTGVVIGIYSSLTTAPVLTGVATGWIKVTSWNSIAFPTSGSFTQAGYTFTISGPSIVGFIEVNGDEAGTITANRLGQFNVTGEWFSLGNTSGAAGQTFQIPTNGLLRYVAGIFIEKSVGSNTYEFYPNNGVNTTTGTTVATGNEAARGKVCWVTTAGLATLGNSGGTGLNGYVPVSGLKVVVPNIFFENNTTAARTANVIPNSAIATRYDFTCTGGGVLNIDKGNFAWYLSASQAYSINVSNSGFIDAILLSEIATPLTFTSVGVGNKPTTALLTSPLTMSLCFAGGTFTDCVWMRASMAASGAHTNSLTDITGFSFINDKIMAMIIRGNATTYSINATRVNNCTWESPTIIQGAATFTTCNGITFNNTKFSSAITGTTVTNYTSSVWAVASNSLNCTFNGLTLPVTNTHPYTCLLQINQAGCDNIKLRNIGTRVAPVTMGSTNACGLIYSLATGAAASNIKVQRVYVSNTRTGIMTGDNSSTKVIEENVFGDYADAVDVMAVLNMYRKGMGGAGALTAQTSVYGTHWMDLFTSATVGRLAILMNEPTSLTQAQVTTYNGAAFTSAGGLYMPVIGHSVLFETPYYALGHTAFTNTALVMAGGTSTNYTYEYAIDKNNGSGWSTITNSAYSATTLGTALSGITGIDASKGFKLRLKITTSVTNTTAITSVYVTTVSTATAQDYQYPLDTNTLTCQGLPTGTDVVVLQAGTSSILAQQDSNPTSSFVFTYSGAQNIDIGFIKQGYVPYYLRNLSLTTSDSTLPISLVLDRNFS